jgi:hypothetical protein
VLLRRQANRAGQGRTTLTAEYVRRSKVSERDQAMGGECETQDCVTASSTCAPLGQWPTRGERFQRHVS